MARDNQRSERSRVRYGYCVNPECENSKKDKKGNRKIFQLSMREEFVCPDCRKELHECPPPTSQPPYLLIFGIIAAVIIVGLALFWGYSKISDSGDPIGGPDTTVVDSIIPGEPGDLGYAIWDGKLKAGQPDGQGTMTYKEQHLIDEKDPKKRIAMPDDYLKATFSEGKLVKGKWYDKNGHFKGEFPESYTGPGHDRPGYETIKIGDYAEYKGESINKKPSGQGTMTYKKQHLIDERDTNQRIAEPGDYIIGEFDNGRLVHGRWFDKSNNVKGVIIIGK